jgi:hypothetical protein
MVPDTHLVDGADWHLRRAWPRGGVEVPLELGRPDGTTVVGRYFAGAADGRRELDRTPGARLGDDPRLLLQPAGADRRLPGLAGEVRRGAELVAHRPGRRAVVRRPSGRYVKFTRAGRAPGLADRHDHLGAALRGIATVPDVLEARQDRLELAALAGRPPLDADTADPRAWDDPWTRVGACLRTLATRVPGPELDRHGPDDEAHVTRTWVARAVAAGLLPGADLGPLLAPLTEEPPAAFGTAHRDLHDGQLLFDEGVVGILDPDTLAAAEPALDLANLLVHLDLRVDQGLLGADARDRAATVLLTTAGSDPDTVRRLPAHRAAARLRLAAVHVFRPRWRELARSWYAEDTWLARR